MSKHEVVLLENYDKYNMKNNDRYRCVCSKNVDLKNKPKICAPRSTQKTQAIYNETSAWCLGNVDVYGINLKDEYQHLAHYILGLLNSKLLPKYISKISTPFHRTLWSCNWQYLEQLATIMSTKLTLTRFKVWYKQIIVLKNMREEKNFKDAVFLEKEVEKIAGKVYGTFREEGVKHG